MDGNAREKLRHFSCNRAEVRRKLCGSTIWLKACGKRIHFAQKINGFRPPRPDCPLANAEFCGYLVILHTDAFAAAAADRLLNELQERADTLLELRVFNESREI